MKRVVAIAFLLVAFEAVYSMLKPLSYAVSPSAMFRANLERTGIYKTQGIQRLHGVKWKFKTERVIEAWFSSPTVSDDTVYFGSDDSYVYALNTLTGESHVEVQDRRCRVFLTGSCQWCCLCW